MKRLIMVGAATLSMILLTKSPVALADTGSQLKQQINQIEKKRQSTLNSLQNKQSTLNTNQNQQSRLMNQVQVLQSQIRLSTYKIQKKQNAIEDTKQSIQTLKVNVKSLQKRMAQRKNLIGERAKSVYVNGGTSNYLLLLLDAKDFNDFLGRVVFFNKIAQQDHSILLQQKADEENLTKDQQALQITLKGLNSDLQSLKQMQASLDSKKAQEQTLLQKLQKKASTIQRSVLDQKEQAALLQKQENAHKAELAQWEKEQEQKKAQQVSHNATGLPDNILPLIQDAQKLQQSTGVPAAITLAQAILESDGGGQFSNLATLGKNLFGIKGAGPAGSVTLPTHEYYGGVEVTIDAKFKAYQTFYQCMVDHASILTSSYYQYYLTNAASLQDYADGLQSAGYATDPLYAEKLLFLIKEYGLAQYDVGPF